MSSDTAASSLEPLATWIDSLPNWGKAAVAGGVALTLYIPYKYLVTRPRKTPYNDNWKPGVVYLYQYPRAKVIPNFSPFCLKVETWLRMSDIAYEIPKVELSVRSKEGLMPFVEFNGVEYYDSNFIIRDLDSCIQHTSIDEHLSAEQRATSRAFESMIEKSLAITTWTNRIENADKILEQFDTSLFGFFGPLLKTFNIRAYAGILSRRIGGTDLGVHNREDRMRIGCDDIRAISHYLGGKHFVHGFKPTRIDACLFANLAQILYAPYDSEHRDVMRNECVNLVEYVERIKARFWPDWIDATTHFSTDTNWKKRPGAVARNGKQSSP